MKVKVTRIRLERAEGPKALCGEVTVTSFGAADAVLHGWAKTAPQGGGYDKCDFEVTFADGETYKGRFDLQREHGRRMRLLETHMREHLTFYAGARCPDHMTEERYRAFLARTDEETKQSCRTFLEKYDLG